MSNDVPKVVTVLLNWNNYSDTAACLDSLADIEYPNMEVVVVDNGSSDDSGDQIEREYEWCEVLFTGDNLGFSRGNNVGIEYAMDDDADYILLLNNDTVVDPDFLWPLVEAAECDSNVGIACSVVRDEDGDVWYAGGSYSPVRATGAVQTAIKSEDPYETGFCFGAMALLSSEFVAQHDVLAPEYFLGVEDMDLSWQATANGWKILVVPESEIVHKVAGSAGSSRNFLRVYHETAGRLTLVSMRLNVCYKLTFLLYFLLSRPIVFGKWIRSGNGDWVRASMQAIWDFLTGRYPREAMVA